MHLAESLQELTLSQMLGSVKAVAKFNPAPAPEHPMPVPAVPQHCEWLAGSSPIQVQYLMALTLHLMTVVHHATYVCTSSMDACNAMCMQQQTPTLCNQKCSREGLLRHHQTMVLWSVPFVHAALTATVLRCCLCRRCHGSPYLPAPAGTSCTTGRTIHIIHIARTRILKAAVAVSSSLRISSKGNVWCKLSVCCPKATTTVVAFAIAAATCVTLLPPRQTLMLPLLLLLQLPPLLPLLPSLRLLLHCLP